MRYTDKVYGDITLPDYVGEIIETPLVQRLHNIATSPLPRDLSTHAHASRFEHSLGVCHLMNLVVKANNLTQMEPLLLISALLHDAGNPPFAHLSESILTKVTGKNGETFLEDMLEEFMPKKLFGSLGVTVEEILSMVTGNRPPLSDLLHGSMDVDNLDNVGRYWFTCTGGKKPFNGEFIASAYRFDEEGKCYLPIQSMEEARRWQQTRQMVYRKVYDEPDLGGAMMIFRAMNLAFRQGKIAKDFFYLSDIEALGLLSHCTEESGHIMRHVAKRNWYKMVFSLETTKPPKKLVDGCENVYDSRSTIADQLAQQFAIPPHAICVYVGKGRDIRRINLPFMCVDGSIIRDEKITDPIYRLKVYIDLEHATKATKSRNWIERLLY